MSESVYELWCDKRDAKIFELETKLSAANKRIAELEASHKTLVADQLEIARKLSDCGIEHSGYRNQAARIDMLIERLRNSRRNVIKYAGERNEARDKVAQLEAAQAVSDEYIDILFIQLDEYATESTFYASTEAEHVENMRVIVRNWLTRDLPQNAQNGQG